MKRFNPNSIKIIRMTKDMTQQQFADSISTDGSKVSRQNIWQWENKEQVPETASLLKIVNAHNVPFEIFFEEAGYSSNQQEG